MPQHQSTPPSQANPIGKGGFDNDKTIDNSIWILKISSILFFLNGDHAKNQYASVPCCMVFFLFHIDNKWIYHIRIERAKYITIETNDLCPPNEQ